MALSLTSTVRLSTGFHMPLLGFGVYQNYDAKPSVLEAFRAGYRHVDSAQAYKNEKEVGDAIKESGLKREDLFITTKCVSKTHGYEKTLKGVDESLAKFGFDYIDLFLIHDPFSGSKLRLETYKALLEAKAAGKIRSVGVSNYGVHHLEEIKVAKLEMPCVNQIELHPLCQQAPIVEYCKANSIVVQAYCPIIRGQMDNEVIAKIASKVCWTQRKLSLADDLLKPQHNRDPAQILLRWSLQKGFVPLPKSATPSRIQSNTKLYDFELSAEEMASLDALDRGKAGAISWNPVEAP
ncbi:NADP-dependent oxidoreductase domain-containing protein [Mycena filopes]|nr:NADP-dependent oxidoreductase domain-containing protein [Mycena filopes]